MVRFVVMVDTRQIQLEAAVNLLNKHGGFKVVSVLSILDTVIVEATGAYVQLNTSSYPWVRSCVREQEVVAF